jgi:16S rRNA (guanine966-N2)-methyltransferase
MKSRGLRIIAGSLKGRRIHVAAVAAVRPTPERVREALFSILGTRLEGAVVIDAYAGSGALGIEALSRGASRVTFLESEPQVARELQDNIERLGIGKACDVVLGRLPEALKRFRRSYDIVLADPPYAIPLDDSKRTLYALGGVLKGDGLLTWERASRGDTVTVSGLKFSQSRRFGDTTVDLYEAGPLQGEESPS